ncbi:MAG: carboxymuconolactone decarboxylase family protein [Thaumarchaeota archaeon]|nr:carboxymuconolactone decarboxylase family protein [Nitrososphaerota archaeon]
MSEEGISPRLKEYLLKEFGTIGEFAKQMARHNPKVLKAWVHYRGAVFEDSAEGLPKKYRELIGMTIEVTTGRPNGKAGERHARLAVRAGATLREVFDTVMLCEFFSGATNYVDYGMAVVRAAEDEVQKIKAEQK